MLPIPAAVLTLPAGSASYVGATVKGTAGPTATLASIGCQAGDFLICIARFNISAPTRGSGGAWASHGQMGYSSNFDVFSCTVASGDLASGVTVPVFGTSGYNRITLIAYRNVGSMALVRNDPNAGVNPATFAGIAKDGSHCGLFGLTGTYPGTALIEAPAAWAQRVSHLDSDPGNEVRLRCFDRLYPANADYADGTGFSIGNPGYSVLVGLFELRSA